MHGTKLLLFWKSCLVNIDVGRANIDVGRVNIDAGRVDIWKSVSHYSRNYHSSWWAGRKETMISFVPWNA